MYVCMYICIYMLNICNHENNKTMCPPGYHHNGFVETLLVVFGHDIQLHHVPKCMSCHKAVVVITGRAHCFHNCIYILHPSCFCEV